MSPDGNVIRIFIGSSTNGLKYAQVIQKLLLEEREHLQPPRQVEVSGWWDDKIFPSGATTVESLEHVVRSHNAALFLATPDDQVVVREIDGKEMRSNVLFEYGLFCGLYGRRRVALAVLRGHELIKPSDLSGITELRLWVPADWKKDPEIGEFKKQNREEIRKWVDDIGHFDQRKASGADDIMPRLNAAIVAIIKRIRENKASPAPDVDYFASEMVAAAANALDGNNMGMDEALVEQIETLLPESKSIFAIDVLGPSGWISPRTYRYLAPQIKCYLRRNTSGAHWSLDVGQELGQAIKTASINVKKYKLPGGHVMQESILRFDNPEEFTWQVGVPRLQFARILLWTKEELLGTVAESIIAIHEAFHVPLFFIETSRSDLRREIDYICFEQDKKVKGFFGRRSENYFTHPIKDDFIPEISAVKSAFFRLLSERDILFAADARYILRAGGTLM